jgi:hypothetical protein
MTWDTVVEDTPAALATSRIVVIRVNRLRNRLRELQTMSYPEGCQGLIRLGPASRTRLFPCVSEEPPFERKEHRGADALRGSALAEVVQYGGRGFRLTSMAAPRHARRRA